MVRTFGKKEASPGEKRRRRSTSHLPRASMSGLFSFKMSLTVWRLPSWQAWNRVAAILVWDADSPISLGWIRLKSRVTEESLAMDLSSGELTKRRDRYQTGISNLLSKSLDKDRATNECVGAGESQGGGKMSQAGSRTTPSTPEDAVRSAKEWSSRAEEQRVLDCTSNSQRASSTWSS